MASILNFVADGGYPGQKQKLKIKKFIWLTVGNGVVESLSDYEVTIDGKVDILTYKGDLKIQLHLLDEYPDALTGPCVLNLNTHTDENSTYRVDNGALVVSAAFGDKRQTVSIAPYNNGSMTECNLSGYINVSAYLEPQ